MLGYYRYPAVFQDTVVFVSEDDLWRVPLAGGVAQRLTSSAGQVSYPVFSPDGQHIAFSATAQGHSEVYRMPAAGGPIERLSYLGDAAVVHGWTAQGILFSSSHNQPFAKVPKLFYLSPEGGTPQEVPIGPATFATPHAQGGFVIQRHGYRDFGQWKRYRGGTAGEIWIDPKGQGAFHKLIDIQGNMARPLWIGDRIYFLCDHEDHGNIYSCDLEGGDLKRHTHHEGFYARNIQTDQKTIVYHAGGALYALPVGSQTSTEIAVEYGSPRAHAQRKFICATRYLESYDVHPAGTHLSTVSRGKPAFLSNWEGVALEFGTQGRYRLTRWLNDGARVLVVSDAHGEERLEIYDAQTLACLSRQKVSDMGRVLSIKVSPTADAVLITNHRNELIHVNLKDWKTRVLDRSPHSFINGFNWSPDGAWAAYSCADSANTSVIKLVEIRTGKTHVLTRTVYRDTDPAFDPEGRYIYFVGHRQFEPSWDTLHFNLSFQQGLCPYLITLQKDLLSPFIDQARPLQPKPAEDEDEKKPKKPAKIKIDLEGIQDRIVEFPISDGVYGGLTALKNKMLFISYPLIDDHDDDDHREGMGELAVYDFETQKVDTLVDEVTSYHVSRDLSTLVYAVGKRLRVLKAGEKPEPHDPEERFTKKGGWIDLERVKVHVDPAQEWHQILEEAWRMQRDHYWHADMSDVDWNDVKTRYLAALPRIGTREELNDLMWEMQGELGTSHAYVVGGDLKRPQAYPMGSLAATFIWDAKKKAYRIDQIVKGDSWNVKKTSPLARPGLNIAPGDYLWEVNGQSLDAKNPPEKFLLNRARQDVRLQISDPAGKAKRYVTVTALASSLPARYQDWVSRNRDYVMTQSNGRVGYVHVPDMGPDGFAEFHRGFLAANHLDGLVIDVRYNGGGNVSPLILDKLARRRLGFDQTRWMGVETYPAGAPSGAMVALTNEYAGSDGDIFSHSFKLMGLGPLIGKRTWGGVVGIWPRHNLVDGGYTTQPEFSFWFKDVGWALENYGVDPDIVVEYTPQDYAQGVDPQLDCAIAQVLQQIDETKILRAPDLSTKPSFKPRKLLHLS